MNATALPALTSLRFFAAWLVVLFHLATYPAGAQLLAPLPTAVRNIVHAGYLGVGLFFVLSGFILAYVYGRGPTVERSRFWWARVARIYPLYLLALLLALPFYLSAALRGAEPFGALLLSPLLLQAWSPATATAWNYPGWTLSVEAVFYLLFPLILPVLQRLGQRALLLVALGSAATLLVAPTLYLWLVPGAGATSPDTRDGLLNLLKYHPLLHLPEFMLGLAAGLHFLRQPKPLPWLLWPALALLLPALALSPLLPYPLLSGGLLAGVFALLIRGVATVRGGWLTSPLLVALGEASYATYLLHVPVWTWLYNLARVAGLGGPQTPALALLYLPTLLVISWVVHRFVEVPAKRALLGLYARRRGLLVSRQ